MPELRQNLATKEWVIIATERARRPEEFVAPPRPTVEAPPAWEEHCPFCPGNEELDLEVLRLPREGAWQLRMVRNKYPALALEGERERQFEGIHRTINAVGYHEIVVDTPSHNRSPAQQSHAELTRVLAAFQLRGRSIAPDPRVQYLIYYKNHGLRAGTSLHHPHAQLIGLPIVPHNIRARTEEARRYFDDHGQCVFCRMLADELADEVRLVAENEQMVAFVPFAAYSPFHIWILPRRHHSNFLDTEPEELAALGALLRTVLRKFYVGLNDPDYNYVIRSAPIHDPGQEYLHWYLALVPRVSRTAGFELGSGMFINVALPEESATFLRAINEEEPFDA